MVHGSDIERDLQSLLEVDDLEVVLSSKHRPRCIIEFISQGLQLLNLDESKRNMLVIAFLDIIQILVGVSMVTNKTYNVSVVSIVTNRY